VAENRSEFLAYILRQVKETFRVQKMGLKLKETVETSYRRRKKGEVYSL
jgi:hypothetical protein